MVPARRLYCLLLELHPLEFRYRFATGMLWIFDELPESDRPGLLLDGVVSLLRLLRPGLWKFAAGLAVNAAVGPESSMGLPRAAVSAPIVDSPRLGLLAGIVRRR
jgi:hypothetical protein